MIKLINIKDIKPADYNPRIIKEQQFNNLKSSIKEIGFVLPIIVNSDNNTIVAGHQRTKASESLGINTVPAIFVNNIGEGDEIKFNQLHNGADMDNESIGSVASGQPTGFAVLDNKLFSVDNTATPVVKEICKLILKYGNCLCAIASTNGKVVLGHSYIKACQLLGYKVNTNIIPKDKAEIALKYFRQDYGEYNYSKIKRQTYVQGLAQLYRTVEKREGRKQWASKLYNQNVLPHIKSKKYSILDFGCGKGAYINSLKDQHTAVGVEFFNHNRHSINVSKGNKMIDELISHIKTNGLFDIVVCDSVLNSVDSVEAEQAVMAVCNLFCKDTLFISGRPLDDVYYKLQMKRDKNVAKRLVEFLDDNNFSAYYRSGNWYFQHWHSEEDIRKLLEEFGFEIINLNYGNGSWQVEARKVKNLSTETYKKAVDFEFNLPLPDGSYNRHNDVWDAIISSKILDK